jgi:hypothetical protein
MKGQNHNASTPAEYIAALDEPRRTEIATIDAFIRKTVPKLKPVMLNGMLGYGPFHYRYASGHEGDCCKVGLASNKSAISLYACGANAKGHIVEQHAKQLGKASCGKGCIRFKKFSDLDHAVLKKVLKETEKFKYGV